MATIDRHIQLVDQEFGNSGADYVRQIYGENYTKGGDIARRFEEHAKNRQLAGFRPPIFALEPRHDRGESVGFRVYLGVPPELPLETVGDVMLDRYGVKIDFVTVDSLQGLLLPEESFMIQNQLQEVRLPAVRLCPVPAEATASV